MRYFEEAGGVAPVTSPKGKPLPKIKTRELFGSKYLARTIAIWATWFFVNFSYYARSHGCRRCSPTSSAP